MPTALEIFQLPLTEQEAELNKIQTEFRQLRGWADIFADIQHHRIALYNGLGLKADGTATKTRPNSFVVDMTDAFPLADASKAQEAKARKIFLHTYQEICPPLLRLWQEAHVGIGEHSLALLLGYAGPPRIAFPFVWERYDKGPNKGKKKPEPTALPAYPRTVSQYMQYCGFGEPIRRQRGVENSRCGNPLAKRATWLIMQGVIKANDGPYRDLYDEVKKDNQWRIQELKWTKGHLNNHAIRLACKQILKDIWRLAA